MNWYPKKRVGLLWGLALLVGWLLADYSLLRGAVGSPINLQLFGRALLILVTLPLLGLTVHAFHGLANLAYHVGRNGIVIRWAASYDVVPMSEIKEIVPFPAGMRLSGGIGWPGYRFGQGHVEGLGRVRLYTTRPAERSLLIRTPGLSYLISPANVEGFVADYRARRLLGEITQWTQEQRLPPLFSLGIWREHLALWLLLPGLALNVALFGYLAARYPDLPPRLILSFDPRGLGDRIGPRSELFLLPVIGLGILLLNGALAAWMHRRERVMAFLLLGNVLLIQALAWLAAARLVG